jgi:F0F1-type ATP synthase assembly protein I
MKDRNNFKIWYLLSFAWQLGFLIAVPIAIFLFLGYLADTFFGTLPFFVIVGSIGGVSVTAYEIYHQLLLVIHTKHHHD